MDTNVVGRKYHDHQAAEGETPRIRNIIVRGLTPATHGNASGIGMAEFCRTQLVEEMDARITRINCITGGHSTGAMVPLDYETDREILDVALVSIGLTQPPEARFLWARNTLDIAEIECSDAYLQEARERDDLEVLSEPRPMPLGEDGNLPQIAELG